MISRITLLFFILFVSKIIELEDVAEKSELLAIILVVGFIVVPIYLSFKILQEMHTIKKEIFKVRLETYDTIFLQFFVKKKRLKPF